MSLDKAALREAREARGEVRAPGKCPGMGAAAKNPHDKGWQEQAPPTNHEVVWDHSSSCGVGLGLKQLSDGTMSWPKGLVMNQDKC